MITSIDAEKAFGKIQHSFNIKTPKQEIEGNFYNPIQGIYKKKISQLLK